mmetsp:Transcript_18283/g.64206  ORF Transcript_18283/g.64206 Transcript_18283/m.64206 type:complete len:217 (-) Transcript_18283:305-955(-)
MSPKRLTTRAVRQRSCHGRDASLSSRCTAARARLSISTDAMRCITSTNEATTSVDDFDERGAPSSPPPRKASSTAPGIARRLVAAAPTMPAALAARSKPRAEPLPLPRRREATVSEERARPKRSPAAAEAASKLPGLSPGTSSRNHMSAALRWASPQSATRCGTGVPAPARQNCLISKRSALSKPAMSRPSTACFTRSPVASAARNSAASSLASAS